MTTTMLAALLLAGGLAIGVAGLLASLRRRQTVLAEILDLPYGERDVPVTAVTERHSVLFEGTLKAANHLIGSFDQRGSLSALLERAQIPVRPAEYLLFTISGAAVASLLLVVLTGQLVFVLAGIAVAVMAAILLPKRRIHRRTAQFEEQLPDAISVIAGSLAAGHTFLRAIQMMCEECEPPLAEEFARVVHETRLGDGVVDGLERMATRLQLRDLAWVVQAVRIQQSVGGKLADLLYTLADFIRAREEIRREVKVLTAEGRLSAWVLGALPPLMLLVIQVTNPGYMQPMYHGLGLVVLFSVAAMVVAGMAVIFRMVKIEV